MVLTLKKERIENFLWKVHWEISFEKYKFEVLSVGLAKMSFKNIGKEISWSLLIKNNRIENILLKVY